MIVVVFAAIVFLTGSPVGWCGRAPKVHRDVLTKQGVVRGYRTYHQYYQFLGIPYAFPPLKGLRYKSPTPPPKWDGILETTHKAHCPQPGDKASDENCLIVNVFTPRTTGRLPVVVFVHDGDFIKGWGDTKPPKTLLKEDFVIVTFNYRLGALGFLCLEEFAEGNIGMKDQIAALYWIQENISRFGGDPHKVTLYGVGSGASSVHLLILSGTISNLVHRAILESGSAISQFVLSYNSVDNARKAGVLMGLDYNATLLDIFNKFRDTKFHVLADLVNNTRQESAQFLPCIERSERDHILIDKDPIMLMEQGFFFQIPLIFVYTNLDGIRDLTDLKIKDLEEILPSNLEFPNADIRNNLLELITEYYVNTDKSQQIPNYFKDIATYPIIKSAFLHASKGLKAVYGMSFYYDSDDIQLNKMVKGILKYFENKTNIVEKDLIHARLVSLFTNFIRYGDPTPLKTSLMPIIWEPISQNINSLVKIKVLNFGKQISFSKPISKRMQFWDKIYSIFYKPHKNELIEEEDIFDNNSSQE